MYDFLLVINTNLPPILHRFRDIAFDRSKKSLYLATPLAFNAPSGGVPLGDRYIWLPFLRLIPRWRGSLHRIIVSDISLKSTGRCFGLHFCRNPDSYVYLQQLLGSAPRKLPNSVK